MNKKILIIFVLLFLIILTSCKNDETKPIENEITIIKEIKLKFNTEEKKVDTENNNIVIELKEDEESDYINYTITIVPKTGYEFDPGQTHVVYTLKDDEEQANSITEKDKITITIKKNKEKEPITIEDEIIKEINYEFDSKNSLFSSINENITYSLDEDEIVNKEDNKITAKYQVLISSKEGYKFDNNVALNWQKGDDEESTLIYEEKSEKRIILIFEIIKYRLFEIDIKLDTIKYEVTSDSEYYEAEIVKPLDYLYIITKVKLKIEPSDELVFIVNDEEIAKEKYKIEIIDGEYILTYKIDDPNWTPYY